MNRNKYHSVRTWSELCQRTFHSKLEAQRATELRLMEMAGEISDLEYQVPFTLSDNPRVKIVIDFCYKDKKGKMVFEDTKGKMTEASRIKLTWLQHIWGVKVKLTYKERSCE